MFFAEIKSVRRRQESIGKDERICDIFHLYQGKTENGQAIGQLHQGDKSFPPKAGEDPHPVPVSIRCAYRPNPHQLLEGLI
jgi:hypothetical protein